MEITDEMIFKSMYILNKSAKKSRDTQNKANKEHNLPVFKRAKKRKDFIYKIKHLAMKKLIDDGKIKFVGIHKQSTNGTEFYLAYYKSESGFSYHRPATKKEIKEYKESKMMQMTVVPATVIRKQDITYTQAIDIILEYIGKTKEEVKNIIEEQFADQKTH